MEDRTKTSPASSLSRHLLVRSGDGNNEMVRHCHLLVSGKKIAKAGDVGVAGSGSTTDLIEGRIRGPPATQSCRDEPTGRQSVSGRIASAAGGAWLVDDRFAPCVVPRYARRRNNTTGISNRPFLPSKRPAEGHLWGACAPGLVHVHAIRFMLAKAISDRPPSSKWI